MIFMNLEVKDEYLSSQRPPVRLRVRVTWVAPVRQPDLFLSLLTISVLHSQFTPLIPRCFVIGSARQKPEKTGLRVVQIPG